VSDLESRLRALQTPLEPPVLAAGDVFYATHPTQVGSLLLAVDGAGTVLACCYGSEESVTGQLAAHVSPRVLRAPSRLDPLRRELDDYLAGRRRDIDLPVSLALASPFTQRVLTGLRQVPYGTTTHYGQLARAVGAVGAGRAVGRALGANPVCIVLPCHRVVRSDGTPGGYAGGPAAKRTLLALEAAPNTTGPST